MPCKQCVSQFHSMPGPVPSQSQYRRSVRRAGLQIYIPKEMRKSTGSGSPTRRSNNKEEKKGKEEKASPSLPKPTTENTERMQPCRSSSKRRLCNAEHICMYVAALGMADEQQSTTTKLTTETQMTWWSATSWTSHYSLRARDSRKNRVIVLWRPVLPPQHVLEPTAWQGALRRRGRRIVRGVEALRTILLILLCGCCAALSLYVCGVQRRKMACHAALHS